MNLVIDDAVEVKLKTKDEDENRRELGQLFFCPFFRHSRWRFEADDGDGWGI